MTETAQAPEASVQLAKSEQNLVWLDCEMTGLDPEKERIIEIAVIVTGPQLTPRVEGPVLVIHQGDAVLDAMDSWNQGTHGRSGLTDRVKASTLTEAQAEDQVLAFLQRYVGKGQSPLCGNTIGQDRRFLVKYMPRLEAFFHYRNIDVSTLKELARRWPPSILAGVTKEAAHTAMSDVRDSIEELRHYRRHMGALGGQAATLAGLCGLGDLVLTCSSTSSRNFSLGKALGEGQAPAALMADRRTVAEGAFTAPVLVQLAQRHGVSMPIVEAVHALLKGAPAHDVVREILARPLKPEQEEPA